MESSEKKPASLRDILNILFKRKLYVVIFFTATFLAAIIVTFDEKPLYRANAQFLVKIGWESVYMSVRGSLNPFVSFDQDKHIMSESVRMLLESC